MTTPTPTAAPADPNRPHPLRRLWDRVGMLLILGLLIVAGCLLSDAFATVPNLRAILLSVVTVGLLACTMAFCLAAGDFDLSVGSVVALSSMVAAIVANQTGSAAVGVLAAAAAGTAVGLTNGLVIARLGVNALIATLATMQMVRGLALLANDGQSEVVTVASYGNLAAAAPLGLPVPAPVLILIATFGVAGFLLHLTAFGRHTLAIGGNAEAARLAGIRVVRTKTVIFTLQGLVAGVAGAVLTARFASGQPNTALGLELQVISACVLGGVSLTGGVGTIGGVAVGVLIMGVVENLMSLQNLDSFWQYVVRGGVLLAAVLLDRLRARG